MNPGDTKLRPRPCTGYSTAQRRPEYEPRRHSSLLSDPSVPWHAQRRPEYEPRRHATSTALTPIWTYAQRRPEYEPGDTTLVIAD